MTRFTAIDLARLPPLPRTAQAFEAMYAERISDLTARLVKANIDYDVGSLETDTFAITEQAGAYREELVQSAIDDAVRSVLLPTATGTNLDMLGATQVPAVQRNILVPATENTPAVLEGDDSFRVRIQRAPEALSTCGPEGAYIFYATEVDGVLDAACYGPMSFGGTRANPFVPLGEVRVPILSVDGNGTATPALIAEVQAELSADERRPIADFVTVSSAIIAPYVLDAVLYVGAGADPDLVRVQALARLAGVAAYLHRPGAAARDQDFYGAAKLTDALGRPIVSFVDLGTLTSVNATPIMPATPDGAYVAPYCTGITVTVEVVDD